MRSRTIQVAVGIVWEGRRRCLASFAPFFVVALGADPDLLLLPRHLLTN